MQLEISEVGEHEGEGITGCAQVLALTVSAGAGPCSVWWLLQPSMGSVPVCGPLGPLA